MSILLLLLPGGAAFGQLHTEQQLPLQKGDGILVRIADLGTGSLPAYREVVDDQGAIEVPYVGLLIVEGLTPRQSAEKMQTTYATAGFATQAQVEITYVTHFEPPPARESLRRNADPRQPTPAVDLE